MQWFARTLRRDIDAVKNALTERWSNGKTEGQINRLKPLKRAMYGRAGTESCELECCPSSRFISTQIEDYPPRTRNIKLGIARLNGRFYLFE